MKFTTNFKNADNPSTIDLIITNKPKSFRNTVGISTRLSDFHKMVLASMKTNFEKSAPKTLIYSDIRQFNKVAFKRDLKEKGLKKLMYQNYDSFEEFFENVLNQHAPKKKRTLKS